MEQQLFSAYSRNLIYHLKKSKFAAERDREDVVKRRFDYLSALEEGLENGSIDPENLVFLDESGFKLGQTPDYGWGGKQERIIDKEIKNKGSNITMVAAINMFGILAAMYCTCTVDGGSLPI